MEEENSKVTGIQKMRILLQNRHIPQEIPTKVQMHEYTENGTYSSSNSKVDHKTQEKFVNQLPISDSQHLRANYDISETKKSRNQNEFNDKSKNNTGNMVKPHKDKMSSKKCYPKFISNASSGCNDGLNNAITTEVNRSVSKSSNTKLTPRIASKSKIDVQAIIEEKNKQPKIQASKKINLIDKKKKSSKISSKRKDDKGIHIHSSYALRSIVKAKNQVHKIAEKPSTNTSRRKPKKCKETVPKEPAKASDGNPVILNGHALTDNELKTLYQKFLLHGHFRADPNLPPFILLLDSEPNINPMKMHCCVPKHCCSDVSQTTVISNHMDKECMHNMKESTKNHKEASSENMENVQYQKWNTCNSPIFVDLTSDTYATATCDASTNTDRNQLNKISSISNTSQWNPIVSTLNNTQRPMERHNNNHGYIHCNDTRLMAQSNNYQPFNNIGFSSTKNCTPNIWTESPTYSSHASHSTTRNQSTINNINSNNTTPIFNNSTIQSNHLNMLPNVPNTTLNSNNESSVNTFQYINPNVFNRHAMFNNMTCNNMVATTNSNNNVLYNTNHSSLPTNNENSVMNRSNNLVNSGTTVLPIWNNFQAQVHPQTYNSNNIYYAYLEQQSNAANIQSFLENSMQNIRNTNVYLNSPNDHTGTSLANNIGNNNTQGNCMNSFVMQTDSSASSGPLPSIHTILPRSCLTGESSVNFRQNVEINKLKDMNNVQGINCIGNNHMEQNVNSNTNTMNGLESYLPILSRFKQDKELSECEESIGNQDSNAVDTSSIDFYLQTQSSKSSEGMIIDSEKPSILQNTKSPNIQQLRQVLVDFTKQYPNTQESYTLNQSESKYKGSSDNLEQTASCITLD